MSGGALAEWISQYGMIIVFLTTFASCLALPVPASIVMMTAGTLSNAGEFSVAGLLMAGISGAVAGDQLGYQLASSFLGNSQRVSNSPTWQKSLIAAREYQQKWGSISIFLSRWLASPLGPWVNFASGLAGYNRMSFTLWGLSGEIVWVCVHVGLGYLFSSQIQAIADLTGNVAWLVIALALVVIIGRKIFVKQRTNHDV